MGGRKVRAGNKSGVDSILLNDYGLYGYLNKCIYSEVILPLRTVILQENMKK